MQRTRTKELLELDSRHVWHPFTQMSGWRDDQPLVIESAEGNYLIDTEGRRWLDGISSLWVTVHGHRHPAIDAAVRAQLDRVAHCTLLGQASVPSIELAAALVPHLPSGLTRLFYSDSGSTAVEVALKQAYQYWQLTGRPEKRKFVALKEAYHGDTVGSVSVGGMDLFHQRFGGLLFDVLRVPTPHAYRWPGRDVLNESIASLEQLFIERSHEIAAFVVEPLVQGAAGMLVQPEGWLRRVAELCRAYDVLLICDEVATGFGRTGRLFAVEHEGVTPDFLCMAKGLTGGYLPLAITATTERIYQAFWGPFSEAKTFFHGHTYTGNPLACAAALASLRLFDEEATLTRMQQPLAVLTKGLQTIATLPHVGEVRQRGLMVGIELVADVSSKEEYPFEARQGFRVCLEARKHGVLLRPLGNVVVMMPPLSLTEREAHTLIEAVRDAVTSVCGR